MMLSANYGHRNILAARRLTNIFADMYPDVSSMNPLVPSIIGVMLNVLHEETVFVLLRRMLESSNKYLVTPHTSISARCVVPVCMELIQKYGGLKYHNHLCAHLDLHLVWEMFCQLCGNTGLPIHFIIEEKLALTPGP